MKLASVSLQNFRNIERAEVSFSDGVNLVCGENAQGKTALIEAIYLLSASRSFRTRKSRELIRHGEEAATAAAAFTRQQEDRRVRAELFRTGEKRVYKNGVKLSKLSEFIGYLNVVLFVPEHLQMVKDGPALRRAFLDFAISQTQPLYPSYVNEYKKLYQTRCALLHDARTAGSRAREYFSLYDERCAAVSAKIALRRREYIETLLPLAAELYESLAEGKEALALSYESDVPRECKTEAEITEFLRTLLEKNLETDIRCGFPVRGIHRDDINLSLDGHPARAYASQGQQRSVVLALKFAEGGVLAARGEGEPVYLLDDVLSELDRRRRAFVLSRVGGRQTILTACDPQRQKALTDAKRIFVREGRFTS